MENSQELQTAAESITENLCVDDSCADRRPQNAGGVSSNDRLAPTTDTVSVACWTTCLAAQAEDSSQISTSGPALAVVIY